MTASPHQAASLEVEPSPTDPASTPVAVAALAAMGLDISNAAEQRCRWVTFLQMMLLCCLHNLLQMTYAATALVQAMLRAMLQARC